MHTILRHVKNAHTLLLSTFERMPTQKMKWARLPTPAVSLAEEGCAGDAASQPSCASQPDSGMFAVCLVRRARSFHVSKDALRAASA